MELQKYCPYFLIAVILLFFNLSSFSQKINNQRNSLDSIILRQKGIVGQLAKNLLTDTMKEISASILRNDHPFQRYKDRVIRHIKIQVLEFGVPIADTSKRTKDKLKRLANKLHKDTREYVIRNNLFFREGEKLSPYMLGDNEKHLRDLFYLLDARIRVIPLRSTRDSVDILILTKDVLSIGGSFRMRSNTSFSIALSEDNFMGWGDVIEARSLVDADRKEKLGYGFAYTKRNMGGSFIDADAGFVNYNRSLSNGAKEESLTYFRLTRPLVSRYMKWTYGAAIEYHRTNNLFYPDSLYHMDFKYTYNLADAWMAWNIDADKPDGSMNDFQLRKLAGIRVLQQNFIDKPLRYYNEQYYAFADLKAVLIDFSLFRQNTYRTQYIYGFGRNEDVPAGLVASITAGWTEKDGRDRAYTGINFQRYYFNADRDYFNFSVGSGAYLYHGKPEDIDIIGKMDFFTRLYNLKRDWKRRIFLSASAARQINNTLLSEPLRLESEYGLREIRNNSRGGNLRIALKGESVFYSPWSVLLFRFAPFVFVKAAYFNMKVADAYDGKLYSSIGGGVRVRNESLIFGTIEFKGMYFPRKNFFNESWRFEGRTSIRFKYNQEFIKRPDFVRVN